MNKHVSIAILLVLSMVACDEASGPEAGVDALNAQSDSVGYSFSDQGSTSSEPEPGLEDPATPAPPTDPPTDPPVDPPVDPEPAGGACVLGQAADYPSCCDLADSRCVPKEHVEAGLHGLFASCEEGSVCVAAGLFEKSGTYTNTSCSSIMGTEGACTSKSIVRSLYREFH